MKIFSCTFLARKVSFSFVYIFFSVASFRAFYPRAMRLLVPFHYPGHWERHRATHFAHKCNKLLANFLSFLLCVAASLEELLILFIHFSFFMWQMRCILLAVCLNNPFTMHFLLCCYTHTHTHGGWRHYVLLMSLNLILCIYIGDVCLSILRVNTFSGYTDRKSFNYLATKFYFMHH
jgi:hypothetical protein